MGTGVIAPPPPPPDSGGGSPGAGFGAAIQRRVGGPPDQGGLQPSMATHPQGALMAQAQAVAKVIDQMGSQNDAFKPFGERAKTTIQAGVSAAIGSGGEGNEPPTGAPGGGGPGSAGAPGGAGGPGGGAGPFPG